MMYEIEITRIEPQPITTRTTTSSASEAEALVRRGAGDPCVVTVAHHEGEISVGEFRIWMASGRAVVRLDEHRDWYAADSEAAAPDSEREMTFIDDDGSFFDAPASGTVSQSQALDALGFWLGTRKKLPTLTWA